MGFAPHDTQSVFQARRRKRAPGAFSPCFPTGSTTLSELNPPRVNSDFLFPRHKTAVLRLFKERPEPSEPKRNRHLFAFSPQQSLCRIEHIGGLCLIKAKAPTATGCGVSRGIGLPVGSGSPLLFGNMLCKIKPKREWKDDNTEAGRQGKHGSIADGCNGGTGALSALPFPTRF